MKNKQKIILITIGAVVLVVLFIALLWPRVKTGLLVQNGNPSATGGQSAVPATGEAGSVPQKSTTVAPVPANITVPNEGDKNVTSSVAVPQIQVSAHPTGGSSQYRQFAIDADNSAFTPATVVAKKGDIIDLEITAVDKDYDFTQPDYGFSAVPIPKGETKRVQFQALNAGKFTFYCTSCGGPNKGPIGYIIITE